MSVSIYMKGDYEGFHVLRRQKNKANSVRPLDVGVELPD